MGLKVLYAVPDSIAENFKNAIELLRNRVLPTETRNELVTLMQKDNLIAGPRPSLDHSEKLDCKPSPSGDELTNALSAHYDADIASYQHPHGKFLEAAKALAYMLIPDGSGNRSSSRPLTDQEIFTSRHSRLLDHICNNEAYAEPIRRRMIVLCQALIITRPRAIDISAANVYWDTASALLHLAIRQPLATNPKTAFKNFLQIADYSMAAFQQYAFCINEIVMKKEQQKHSILSIINYSEHFMRIACDELTKKTTKDNPIFSSPPEAVEMYKRCLTIMKARYTILNHPSLSEESSKHALILDHYCMQLLEIAARFGDAGYPPLEPHILAASATALLKSVSKNEAEVMALTLRAFRGQKSYAENFKPRQEVTKKEILAFLEKEKTDSFDPLLPFDFESAENNFYRDALCPKRQKASGRTDHLLLDTEEVEIPAQDYFPHSSFRRFQGKFAAPASSGSTSEGLKTPHYSVGKKVPVTVLRTPAPAPVPTATPSLPAEVDGPKRRRRCRAAAGAGDGGQADMSESPTASDSHSKLHQMAINKTLTEKVAGKVTTVTGYDNELADFSSNRASTTSPFAKVFVDLTTPPPPPILGTLPSS